MQACGARTRFIARRFYITIRKILNCRLEVLQWLPARIDIRAQKIPIEIAPHDRVVTPDCRALNPAYEE
jgi:hypothetical protein